MTTSTILDFSRFVMMVKKGYRNPPYHNWMHAFSVTHFCYTLFKNCPQLEKMLTDLEILALFISCMCHDIDHRGTNNAFQETSVGEWREREREREKKSEGEGERKEWGGGDTNNRTNNISSFLSLFPQNTVLASLYSSEGSVMEVGISLIAIIILFYSF